MSQTSIKDLRETIALLRRTCFGLSRRLLKTLLVLVVLLGLLRRFSDLAGSFRQNLALLNSTGWAMMKNVGSNDSETIFFPANGCQPQTGTIFQPESAPDNVEDLAATDSCYALLQSRLACLQGKGEAAAAWFDLAQKTCPRQEQVNEWAGALAWGETNKQEAIRYWLQTKQGESMMLHQAQHLIKIGNFTEGQLLLEAALPKASLLENQRQLAQAFENLGLAYQRQSKWDLAIVAYEKALNLDSKRTSTHLLLAITYRNDHQWNEAEAAFRQALYLVPEADYLQRALILEHTGLMQQEQGAYAQAYDTLEEAFCLRSKGPESTGETLPLLRKRLERLQEQLNGQQAFRNAISCPTQAK